MTSWLASVTVIRYVDGRFMKWPCQLCTMALCANSRTCMSTWRIGCSTIIPDAPEANLPVSDFIRKIRKNESLHELDNTRLGDSFHGSLCFRPATLQACPRRPQAKQSVMPSSQSDLLPTSTKIRQMGIRYSSMSSLHAGQYGDRNDPDCRVGRSKITRGVQQKESLSVAKRLFLMGHAIKFNHVTA